LEAHELAALGTEHVILPSSSRGRSGLVSLFNWWFCAWQQALLQSGQAGAPGGSEESEIAHLHKTAWQDMLEEALDEVLHGESAGFELAGV
jgi:hypothetical protein